MNDLTTAAVNRRRWWDPIPPPFTCILVPLFLTAITLSLLILVVVHNALPFSLLLVLSLLLLSFVIWNVYNFRNDGSVSVFLDRMPLSDLRTAQDGQIVKIDGIASCGDLSLESSYEKIDRCIYVSTLLYEYKGFGWKMSDANNRCFSWNLTYNERCIGDFYITDVKSGIRALVKAGFSSKVNPLVKETVLVNTSGRNRELSSTLKKWLEERHLSTEARLLRLKEGYIKEGSSLTVMGVLCRKSGALMIIPPPEPITSGCVLTNFLLPIDVHGLVLTYPNGADTIVNSTLPD